MTNKFKTEVIWVIERMTRLFQSKKNKKLSTRITRGRSTASSNEFEEEIAKLIEKNTNHKLIIYVDYPLSLPKNKDERVKTIYPDIILIKDKEILAILEVKIDLGYLSADWSQNRKIILEKLKKSKIVNINNFKYTISKKFTTATVLLTERNDHKKVIDFRKNHENTFALISQNSIHPNNEITDIKSYIDEITKDKVNHENWKSFYNFLKIF